MLRIYAPQKGDYKIEDILLEQNLGAPILQIAVGKFSNSCDNSLAVLSSKKLSVY